MIGFNSRKTVQATAYLLKKEPEERMNYMRLLKLLYLADRRSLKDRRAPICGGRIYAMKKGPVISQVLDLIKGNDPESEAWEKVFARQGFDVALRGKHPGVPQLSRAELRILDEISEEHRDRDEWALVDWCHENLAEYEKNAPKGEGWDGRNLISLDDVLEAIGASAFKGDILSQINANVHLDKLFGDHSLPQG